MENALFLVHLLSLVCIEDSIYTSVAFVPLSVLITRFKAEVNSAGGCGQK